MAKGSIVSKIGKIATIDCSEIKKTCSKIIEARDDIKRMTVVSYPTRKVQLYRIGFKHDIETFEVMETIGSCKLKPAGIYELLYIYSGIGDLSKFSMPTGSGDNVCVALGSRIEKDSQLYVPVLDSFSSYFNVKGDSYGIGLRSTRRKWSSPVGWTDFYAEDATFLAIKVIKDKNRLKRHLKNTLQT